MKGTLRKPLAAVFGVLLVTGAVVGGMTVTNLGVSSVGDTSVVGSANAQAGSLLGANSLVMAAYGEFQDLVTGPNTEDLQKADALETKKEIYDQASLQKENNDLLGTSYNNYLSDTETIALLEGKNAYIRALENGSSESVAKNRATEAVADYYAVKQQNLIASWNISATLFNSSHYTATNTSGVESTFVDVNYTSSCSISGCGEPETTPNGLSTVSVSLVNASSESALAYEITDSTGDFTVGPAGGNQSVNDGNQQVTVTATHVKGPNSNYDALRVVTFEEYGSKWSEIEAQNSEVQDKLDKFINNTYDSYQQRDINASDLVDPYLGAREYTPETSETWNLRTLSSLGLNGPQNLSTIGLMNITAGGAEYQGVLMTDASPAGGFVVNETYNATALNGSQFIAQADGGTRELSGEFTIKDAQTTDGATFDDGEAIEYRDVTYETASTEEFQALQEQLDELTASLNARQQNLRNSGGVGWLPDFGSLGLGAVAPALVIGGAAVLLLNRA